MPSNRCFLSTAPQKFLTHCLGLWPRLFVAPQSQIFVPICSLGAPRSGAKCPAHWASYFNGTVLSACVLGLTALAAAAHSGEAPTPLDPAQVRQRIEDLGSDRYETREKAHAELLAQGLRVLPQLEEARRATQDQEVALRLERIAVRFALLDYRAKLEKPVTLNYRETPLEEALADLARQVGLPLALGPESEDAREIPIDLEAKSMSGEHALNWLCRCAQLVQSIEPRRIALTKQAYQLRHYETRLYEAGNLGLPLADVAQLFEERLLAADPTASVATHEGKLAIRGPAQSHEEVERFLGCWRKQAAEQVVILREEPPAWMSRLKRQLAEPKVSFEFENRPLTECIALLRRHTDAPLLIDPGVLEGGIPIISLRVKELPLVTALEWVLRCADLDYSLIDEAVFISNQVNVCAWAIELHIYSVERLTKGPGMPLTTASITDLIRNRVRPDSWDPNQGTTIQERGGKLVVMQSAEVHAGIVRLLGELEAWQKRVRAVEPEGKRPERPLDPKRVPTPWIGSGADRAWRDELRAKLDEKRIHVDFRETPLGEALDEVAEQTGLVVGLDPRRHTEGVGQLAVTLRAENLRAASVLNLLARISQLAVDLRDGGVCLTKRGDAHAGLEVGIHYTRDLKNVYMLATWIVEGPLNGDFADPATSLQEHDGNLIVMAEAEGHARLGRLLEALRRPAAGRSHEVSDGPEAAAAPACLDREALRKKLALPVSPDVAEAPLAQAFEEYGKVLGAPIVLDPGAGANLHDRRIALAARERPGGEVLREALKPLALDYVLGDEAVWVALKSSCDGLPLKVRVYDLDGLRILSDELLARVKKEVAPEFWMIETGAQLHLSMGKLVVVQTPEVHAALEAWLVKERQRATQP
ncbi:MAG: hypothetical protein M5U26_27290 [Planctomycetota bacterium]|nr:hypothetical protein [Planctomycetota bacterium]